MYRKFRGYKRTFVPKIAPSRDASRYETSDAFTWSTVQTNMDLFTTASQKYHLKGFMLHIQPMVAGAGTQALGNLRIEINYIPPGGSSPTVSVTGYAGTIMNKNRIFSTNILQTKANGNARDIIFIKKSKRIIESGGKIELNVKSTITDTDYYAAIHAELAISEN